MIDGNTHRDNIKDALKGWMNPNGTEDEDLTNAESATVADLVFDALGITENEQDTVGGHFRLIDGGKCYGQDEPWGRVCLKCKETKNSETVTTHGVCDDCVKKDLDNMQRKADEELIPCDSGEFSETVLTSQAKKSDYVEMYPDEVNAYTKRTKELADGAKYTSSEFKGYAVGKRVTETGGWYVTLQTPICKYGQAYDKDVTLDEAKTNFVNKYYQMYIDDYERSTGQVD